MVRFHTSRQAFTLVELIVVMGIIGVLAIMAIPMFEKYVATVKDNRSVADIRTLDKACIAYYIEKNVWPATLQVAGVGSQVDPWSRPYEYQLFGGGATPLEDFIGNALNTEYDLYSKGPDGATATSSADAAAADDIIRSNDGQYSGLRAGL